MPSIIKKRNELAHTMFGRGWGACNYDERVLVTRELGQIPANEVLCERGHDGAWVCSAVIGGVRLHRVYMGYSKSYAVRHFKNNPPA